MKSNIFIIAAASMICMASCNDEPYKYEISDGVPTVSYVRSPDITLKDSLLVGAPMKETICLVGDNLRSITALYFNDQAAVLNTSYITDHTLITQVPSTIPGTVTDKIYMHTSSGAVVEYPFRTIVPAPDVAVMSNEWAKPGEEVTISGDYFINDESTPLKVTMPDGSEICEFTALSKTAISFIIPQGCTKDGYITVESIYGASRSLFQFHDKRNILFDFDGSHGGLKSGHGWRSGRIGGEAEYGMPEIDGSYLYLGGVTMEASGNTWNEDNFCMNYWPDGSAEYPELCRIPAMAGYIDQYSNDELVFKFEVYIPDSNPWTAGAMQLMLTTNEMVSSSNENNSYYGIPARGLWMPWRNASSGVYSTGGSWTTVSIPLSSFDKNDRGEKSSNILDMKEATGLTIFVWAGGVAGVSDCDPLFAIDNIRIVPIK